MAQLIVDKDTSRCGTTQYSSLFYFISASKGLIKMVQESK